ncbi:MAG: phosphoribosyltransferase [Blastocatellales bacterium]
MGKRFRDRTQAGRLLAEKLIDYGNRRDVIVLALPRGGVPVAYEVARALHAPLDVLIVRKLGLPDQPELAMGAIASGGVRVLNEDLLSSYPIPAEVIESVTALEQKELERRERIYRGNRPVPEVRGRTVILVDDGIATGTTMRSAVEALKKLQAARIIIAVPVAPESAREEFGKLKDQVVFTSLTTPEMFIAISLWYEEFPQTSDQEVRDLIERAAKEIKSAQFNNRNEITEA